MCDSLFSFFFFFFPASLDFCLCNSRLLWLQHSPGIKEMEAIAVEERLMPECSTSYQIKCYLSICCNLIPKRLFFFFLKICFKVLKCK